MVPRATIRKQVRARGVGLFTAAPCSVCLRPRRDAPGIRLRRVDASLSESDRAWFEASIDNLRALPGLSGRHTVLGPSPQGPHAATTEHLLSALAGLGITDAQVEIDGPEIPMFDGSSEPFCRLIEDAGIEPVHDGLSPLKIRERLSVEGPGGASIVAQPREHPGGSFTYRLDYGGVPGAEGIAPATARWDGEPAVYRRDIAPARTFCLVHEAMALRQAGLFRHVTPKEMLVIDPGGQPIDNALRFKDEPARHKLLDLIGDLALVGRPIQADITATRSGHSLNHEMARQLLAASIPA
ncbi:MAG: UDP-3-O-acyl-N-acetylglucosamine deacetylase [Phycisphaeraceae bacterium]|nr:UDP-3-O-acyl-N-acetylglucosamine deacetylase [Phycisphaerae bacterium]MBX3391033.1 UDP-3-O-acyl-N-acetylglucosamine deacetylase [Phycisphaeraceae bacterium]